MNYEDIRQRVTTSVNDAWVARFPTNELVWENQAIPNMEDYRKMFCSIRLVYEDAYQSAMVGSNSPSRMVGRIEFDIYVVKDSGSKEATEVFDFLESLMKLVNISGIVFKVPRKLPSFEAVGWFRSSGVAPFYAESFTP